MSVSWSRGHLVNEESIAHANRLVEAHEAAEAAEVAGQLDGQAPEVGPDAVG